MIKRNIGNPIDKIDKILLYEKKRFKISFLKETQIIHNKIIYLYNNFFNDDLLDLLFDILKKQSKILEYFHIKIFGKNLLKIIISDK